MGGKKDNTTQVKAIRQGGNDTEGNLNRTWG